MYVVIAGGGRIGRYIARDMTSKGHEVTIIERLAERCEQRECGGTFGPLPQRPSAAHPARRLLRWRLSWWWQR